MTWPLLPRLTNSGRTDKRDGLFSIWVSPGWRTRSPPTPRTLQRQHLLPERETLAYSEANLGAGALAVPVWLATHNPYATHNSVVLLAFVLAFVAMYPLARHLGPGTPAIVAGVLFAYCPFSSPTRRTSSC